MNITLAAGGTGGHMVPAHALAAELKARGHGVMLVTDERGALRVSITPHLSWGPLMIAQAEGFLGLPIVTLVARAVLEWRQNDGWPATIVPDATYVLPPTPGNWQPTPPTSSIEPPVMPAAQA